MNNLLYKKGGLSGGGQFSSIYYNLKSGLIRVMDFNLVGVVL
jgi:hypothetical protein